MADESALFEVEQLRAAQAASSDASVTVNGREVGHLLASQTVDKAVAQVARHALIRDKASALERAFALHGPCVMAGRDIGSVILPEAPVKVFIDAELSIRARRRAAQRGIQDPQGLERTRLDLGARDRADSSRPVAPLTTPDDAFVLDNSRISVEQAVERICAYRDMVLSAVLR